VFWVSRTRLCLLIQPSIKKLSGLRWQSIRTRLPNWSVNHITVQSQNPLHLFDVFWVSRALRLDCTNFLSVFNVLNVVYYVRVPLPMYNNQNLNNGVYLAALVNTCFALMLVSQSVSIYKTLSQFLESGTYLVDLFSSFSTLCVSCCLRTILEVSLQHIVDRPIFVIVPHKPIFFSHLSIC
jgi:hypothetical protein